MFLFKINQRHLISFVVCFMTIQISSSLASAAATHDKHINSLKWKQSSQIKSSNLDFIPISSSNDIFVNPLDVKRNVAKADDGAERNVAETSKNKFSNNISSSDSDSSSSSRNSKRNNNNNSHQSISIRLKDLQQLMTQLLIDRANTEKTSNVYDSDNAVAESRRSYDQEVMVSDRILEPLRRLAEQFIFEGSSGSGTAVKPTGRFFLFRGFKKFMWPIFIGIQVAKTVLLAMFLPSILGSIGKMVGKGLVSVSNLGRPSETVDDFEFKDNPTPHDPAEETGMGYNYPQQHNIPADTNDDVASHMYDTAATNNALSMYGLGEQKVNFGTNSYNLQDFAQNKRKETVQSKKDDFKIFHDIPASSLLLTNYDPFYSPLLSRLDSVFHQLNLNSDNEVCREKLVCLMYSSPAKYMPYSNLVSAQLSRELNELRKPVSDNIEILRFFKYMKAAKDGQDGQNCHSVFKKCTSFTDTSEPAMITTFNDINKLVQARNLK